MRFFDDLPEIKCRPHAQAKRLKLTVSSSGIRLTYPPKTSTKTIEQFLKQSYSWLIETHRKQKTIELVVELPKFLNLAYGDNTVLIHYEMNVKKSRHDVQQQIFKDTECLCTIQLKQNLFIRRIDSNFKILFI